MILEAIDADAVASWVASIDTFVFDCDGVREPRHALYAACVRALRYGCTARPPCCSRARARTHALSFFLSSSISQRNASGTRESGDYRLWCSSNQFGVNRHGTGISNALWHSGLSLASRCDCVRMSQACSHQQRRRDVTDGHAFYISTIHAIHQPVTSWCTCARRILDSSPEHRRLGGIASQPHRAHCRAGSTRAIHLAAVEACCLQWCAIVRIVHGSTLCGLCVQVLWSGDSVVPGAVDAIASLQRSGKRVFLVTNNSTKSKVEFAKKVSKLGFSG